MGGKEGSHDPTRHTLQERNSANLVKHCTYSRGDASSAKCTHRNASSAICHAVTKGQVLRVWLVLPHAVPSGLRPSQVWRLRSGQSFSFGVQPRWSLWRLQIDWPPCKTVTVRSFRGLLDAEAGPSPLVGSGALSTSTTTDCCTVHSTSDSRKARVKASPWGVPLSHKLNHFASCMQISGFQPLQ